MTLRRATCPHCRTKLEQGQKIHSACIEGFAQAQEAKATRAAVKRAKVAARVERVETRQRKEAIKSQRELLAEAQVAFNAYIRARDEGKPCICCGQPFEPQKPGGSMDAGHYLGRGSSPQHRFNEDNVFGQRKNCNRPGGTTRDAFRAGVLARIGQERLEALERDSRVPKWERAALIELKAYYRARLRELKARKA